MEDREGVAYALKFFADHEDFSTEARLHYACGNTLLQSRVDCTDAALPAVVSSAGPRFMPRVEFVRDCGSDRHGDPLPPCIVMEKGESLQEWCNRADPDVFASVAVRPTAIRSMFPEPPPQPRARVSAPQDPGAVPQKQSINAI